MRLKLQLLIGAGLLCFACSGPAQTYSPVTAFQWLGNAVGQGLTNLLAWYPGVDSHTNASGAGIIEVRKQDKVGIYISFMSSTNKAGTNVFAFVYSIDGTRYDTNTGKLVAVNNSVPVAGGAMQSAFTNLDTYGAGYIKLWYISNDCSTANGGASLTFTTNIVVKYAVKSPTQ